MIKKILAFVRMLLSEVPMSEQQYTRGYRDALTQVEDKVVDLMWEEGVDDDAASVEEE
jgi:hypothetical protein